MQSLVILALMAILLGIGPAAAQPAPSHALDGELIIRLQPGITLLPGARATGVGAASLAPMLVAAHASAVKPIGSGSNTYRVRFAHDDLPALAQRIASHPAVVYAEPNYQRTAMRTSNDPVLRQQWALRNIQAPEAWDLTTGNEIVIALLDTGVSSSHPDLKGKLVPGYNALNGSDNTRDDEGHGTYTAGVAAAGTNNGVGIAGVCWGCKIMPIKVLDRQGRGNDATIAEGIRWAVDHDARIISMSLGGDEDSQVLRDAVAYAHERNVLLIAASGNGQADGNQPNYPAAYASVLAVSATDGSSAVTGFSTTGPFVDIAAPGVGVWSTAWENGSNSYAASNGTSAACPHVAGVAALVLSLRPDLSADQLAQVLTDSAEDQGPPGKDSEYGYGRVNAFRAVQLATNPNLTFRPPPPPPPPVDQRTGYFAPVPPPPDGANYFPQTSHTLRGVLRNYWEKNGGLPIFGYPISEPFIERGEDGRDYTVQYFERHKLELHPENNPPYDVLLSRLGNTTLEKSARDWNSFPRSGNQPGCRFFPETGQSVCEPFLSYWRANGLEFDGRRGKSEAESLALFGLPLSGLITETLSDGKQYQVQWFERARFELHPENTPPYNVQLGLLANELRNDIMPSP